MFRCWIHMPRLPTMPSHLFTLSISNIALCWNSNGPCCTRLWPNCLTSHCWFLCTPLISMHFDWAFSLRPMRQTLVSTPWWQFCPHFCVAFFLIFFNVFSWLILFIYFTIILTCILPWKYDIIWVLYGQFHLEVLLILILNWWTFYHLHDWFSFINVIYNPCYLPLVNLIHPC